MYSQYPNKGVVRGGGRVGRVGGRVWSGGSLTQH